MEHNPPVDQELCKKSKESLSYLWDFLSPQRKWGVFLIHEGFKLYVFPMDIHNKSFLKTLGLKLYEKESKTLTEWVYPLESSKKQYLAFVGFIKAKSGLIMKFLNPEVLIEKRIEEEKQLPIIVETPKDHEVEFILDLLHDYEQKIVPLEDLVIRLESGPPKERINEGLSRVDQKTRRIFENFLELIILFKKGKLPKTIDDE
jgi:hypothetical protein